MTPTQRDANLSMYGVSDIDGLMDSVCSSLSYRCTGGHMAAMSFMSDAQELMAFGDVERARQRINIAKHILCEIMEGRMIGTWGRA
jgi:hypothetical protein